MIEGVAQQVHQGLEQAVDNALVDGHLAARDGQLRLLAELGGQLAGLPREAGEQRGQGRETQAGDRGVQVRQGAVQHGLPLRERSDSGGACQLADRVGQGVLGDDGLV